jgi:hypothetical protein
MKEGGGHGKSLSGFSCLAIMRQTPDKFPICAGARSAELVHNAGILGVQLINADEVFGTHKARAAHIPRITPYLRKPLSNAWRSDAGGRSPAGSLRHAHG